MNENQIKAFSQPTWELYREVVLSIEGNDEGDVEGIPVYEHYHKKVMDGNYGKVGLILI